jgi:hypothetical protein
MAPEPAGFRPALPVASDGGDGADLIAIARRATLNAGDRSRPWGTRGTEFDGHPGLADARARAMLSS